jgi:hypothetical protein
VVCPYVQGIEARRLHGRTGVRRSQGCQNHHFGCRGEPCARPVFVEMAPRGRPFGAGTGACPYIGGMGSPGGAKHTRAGQRSGWSAPTFKELRPGGSMAALACGAPRIVPAQTMSMAPFTQNRLQPVLNNLAWDFNPRPCARDRSRQGRPGSPPHQRYRLSAW